MNKLKRTVMTQASRIRPIVAVYHKIKSKKGTKRQKRLSYLIVNILNHCNLNCKGCGHFAPLAEEYFVPFETVKKDLAQMSRLMSFSGGIKRIGVMGGEPLLHPELNDILRAARQAFPQIEIEVVTNGILLLKHDNKFWDTCRENNITIVVTKYPINVDYEKIVKTAKDKSVGFYFYGSSGVVTKTLSKFPMDLEGNQDITRSFNACGNKNNCTLLMEGKLYTCPVAPKAFMLNLAFCTKMEVANEDFLNIYKVQSGKEVLDFLTAPKPFCRYCKTAEITRGHPYESSKKSVTEWTN